MTLLARSFRGTEGHPPTIYLGLGTSSDVSWPSKRAELTGSLSDEHNDHCSLRSRQLPMVKPVKRSPAGGQVEASICPR